MAYTPGPYSRFQDFSNPDRSYKGASLGTSSRDNARAFRNSAPTVANFNSPESLGTTISAFPTPGASTNEYTFSASACGGTGDYDYEWRLSTDPTNPGSVVSTDESFSVTLQENQTHYATLEVSSGGQTASATRSVYVPPSDCDDQFICEFQRSVADNNYESSEIASTEAASHLKPDDVKPEEILLDGNYPNPFGTSTTIGFSVPQQTDATLTLFDITGRRITTIAEGRYQPGQHSVMLDATSLSSGTYIVHLDAEGQQETTTITVVK